MSRNTENKVREAISVFQALPASVLAAIVNGEIDARAVAANELRMRGCDANGEWVGFGRAGKLLEGAIAGQPGIEHLQPLY